jgi:sulfotransferase
MKQFYFLSGVPRSGSTVFATLISQNPNIHTTPTSPLLDLLLTTKPNWKQVSAFQTNTHSEQYLNIERGIISGCYQHITKPIVLEKHRSWAKYSDYIEQTFQTKPRIICTTRRISEVLASFILIINKADKVTYIDRQLMNENKPVNNKTRCRLLWENYISVPWKSLKIGYETHKDNMIFIDYNDIVNSPEETLKRVYNFCELEYYTEHYYDNLTNPQPENDDAYGIVGLHDVRKTLGRTSLPPEEILGEELCSHYDNLQLEFWTK